MPPDKNICTITQHKKLKKKKKQNPPPISGRMEQKMNVELTKGCILQTYNGDAQGTPTVQVIDIKKLGANASAARYRLQGAPLKQKHLPLSPRLVISDGVHYQQAMLATDHNSLVESNRLSPLCIIRLTQCTCTVIATKQYATSSSFFLIFFIFFCGDLLPTSASSSSSNWKLSTRADPRLERQSTSSTPCKCLLSPLPPRKSRGLFQGREAASGLTCSFTQSPA